jgi:hypothetical protein
MSNKKEGMSPLHLEILLHAYTKPFPYPSDARVTRAYMAELVREGLLYQVDGEVFYRTTPKGTAHVKQLCGLPFPQQAWIGIDGQVIGV